MQVNRRRGPSYQPRFHTAGPKVDPNMTNNSKPTAPHAAEGPAAPTAFEDLDLTPDGLADAPAHQQDPDSLVHTGNS